MAEISATQVRELREASGAGVMECRHALDESRGDMQKALAILQEQGAAKAAKRADREASQGVVESYMHGGGRIGAMVEVNCETDFVARTDDFKALAHDLAMQVAASAPRYLSAEEKPEDEEGEVTELCLLEQPFIKDPSKTIKDLVDDAVRKTGENVRVRRFARFALGAE